MSALSVLMLLVGITNLHNGGLPFAIIGGACTLFFGGLAVFLLYAAVRLGRRDRRRLHGQAPGSRPEEVAMPLFGRNRQSPMEAWSLTANVEEGTDGWRVTWFGDGKTQPPEFEEAGLTKVTDLAARAALALYAVGPRPPGTVLGFAIYPRTAGKKGAMYDVSGGPGRFRARDMQGSQQEVEAADLEQLVEAVRQNAGADIAMLRWVRPFAELPTELPDQ
jgi:hypothetical protein